MNSIQVYIMIYVDDILITCSKPSAAIDELLYLLHSDFAIKDLDSLNFYFYFFLGIEVVPNNHGVVLSP